MWGFSVYSTVLYDPPPARDPFGSRAGTAVFALLMPEDQDFPELIDMLADELKRVEPSYDVLIFRPFLDRMGPDESRLADDYPRSVTFTPLLDRSSTTKGESR